MKEGIVPENAEGGNVVAKKKYGLSGQTKVCRLDPCNPVVLYRIYALRDFGDVKAGDLGGYIEKESNLSQDGDCWVYDDAMVFDKAEVTGDARVRNHAMAYGYAVLRDRAMLSGWAKAFGYAEMSGDEQHDHGWILDHVGDINGEFKHNLVI